LKIKAHYKQLLHILLFCFLINFSPLIAQDQDFELWNEISLKKEINKNFGIVGSFQLRLDQNATTVKSYFPEIGIYYNINKYLRINFDYRYTMLHKGNNSYLPKNRYNLGLRFRKKVKPFVFKYKLEYQYGLDNFLSREIFNTDQGSTYLRNKITIDYQLNKKWTPFVASEIFYHIKKLQSQFDIYRIAFGLDYEFNKRNEITCAYLIEKEFNVYKPQSVYVLKIKYAYTF